jgi:diguanylate cyclase (GGDEF)-like protein
MAFYCIRATPHVRRKIFQLCLLMAFVSARNNAYALDPQKSVVQYVHEVWNPKSGLPEADVMAILQSRDGYLWVGTEEGLARFDGVHFTVFDRKNALLPANRVQALAETPDGSLWIGTENGLSRFKDGRFTNYSTRDGLPNNSIRALWAEPGGPLWITTAAGVRMWRSQRFEPDPSIEGMARDYPRQFLRMANGDTLLASDTGLAMIEARATMPKKLARLDGKVVRAMIEDSGGTLWIGTTVGLYRMAEGQIKSYAFASGSAHPEITALLEDRDHNLWVGTLGDGLIRINKEGMLRYSVADGLTGIEVKSLYQDSAGNLWVGTFGGGLEVFRDTMFTPYGQREGISQDVVWTVMQSRDSSIWIGTQAGGLNRLRNDKVTVYSTRAGFADDTVGSLFEGRDGTLWLGKDSGLSRFMQEKVAGAPAANPPLREQVHAIYEDASGDLWIGTRTRGLVRLRGNQYTYFTSREGLADNDVQTIIPSKYGGLWIGTLGGLSHYQNGTFTKLTFKDGLSADQVVALYEDADGTLWIGAYGLNRLKNGKITRYGEREGLFDQTPLAILEDDNGYLWLSTNKGIFRVSKRQLNDFAEGKTKQLTPVAFGTTDGMRSAECNGGSSPAAWKDSNGNLWFPTVAGVLKISPQRLDGNSQPLPVHIENILADKIQVVPAGSLRLPPGGHELEFHYSAPYFAGAGRVRYEYRLEGFDRDWVDAGARTVAYYTNLPPGSYCFRVVAAASGTRPGKGETAVSFYLTPHFYQTRLFHAAVVIAGLGLVFLIWLWTNRSMIRRQNELRRLVMERTRELEAEKAELLEAKIALAQQASHDSLTGLMNRAAILRVLEEEMRQAEREHTRVAVILIDLDHFKGVNDSYGHLVGDDVLKEFARRLSSSLRPYDHAGRFGGEEFLVVMPGLAEQNTRRIRDLQRLLSGEFLISGEGKLQLTCSIGAAWFGADMESTESLLDRADQALYAAKANGRNRVEVTAQLRRS